VVFLDINTFFSPKAGGIRTYHRAKIEWFRQRPDLGYFLVYPGPFRKELKEGGNIALIEAYGPALTRDTSGYRLLIDFLRVFRVIRAARPDVIEAGDPWLTGLFCLALRKLGLYRGLLVSFYHSDPVPTYILPWSRRGRFQRLRALLARLAGFLFYRLQRGYDLTVVASRTMEASLRSRGVRSVAHLPFGVPAFFLEGISAAAPKALPGEGPVGLLYAGRLDRDKGVDLLLESLPFLLEHNVQVTVMGRGALAPAFAEFRHPRYRYLGFVPEPEKVRAAYDGHHVLLAPGPHETFGLGVLEGMARGLVVVGPDAGGTGELLLEAASSFRFPAGDGDAFRKAVLAALRCDWRAEIVRSRSLALRYGGWDDAIGRMIGFYADRLAGQGHVRAAAEGRGTQGVPGEPA
jgi:alpha-1,6-mannosyltransferase